MPETLPSFLRAHTFGGLEPGPRLIVLGAVHGDEVCGTRAIERVLKEIEAGSLLIECGQLTLVPVTNPLAYQRGQRQGDRNLNRKLQPSARPQDFEDHVANVLCQWLEAHDVLLDLHSFHTGGEPFVMLGPRNNNGSLEPFADAADEERLAAHLGPRRIVEGWLDTYAKGTQRRTSGELDTPGADPAFGVGTTEYMRSRGGYALTLECGQHADPAAPEVAYRALRQTLALLRMSDLPLEPPPPTHEVLRLVDVVDVDAIGDRFARPWASFDAVARGDLIGTRADGRAVHAPSDGFIVFPHPTARPGTEWFYFAVRSDRRIAAPR